MDDGSLKRRHVPTFDSPGKPDNKRRSQELSCNIDTPSARHSIAHASVWRRLFMIMLF